jgi:hypothetical protein
MHQAIHLTLGFPLKASAGAASDLDRFRETISSLDPGADSARAVLGMFNLVIVDPGVKPFAEAIARMRKSGATVSLSSSKKSGEISHLDSLIAKITHGHLALLPRAELSKPGLIAVNAFYFHGLWPRPIARKLTRRQVFHALDSDVIVPMMTTSDKFNIREEGRFVGVEMPYAFGRYRLVIVTTTDRSSTGRSFVTQISPA